MGINVYLGIGFCYLCYLVSYFFVSCFWVDGILDYKGLNNGGWEEIYDWVELEI